MANQSAGKRSKISLDTVAEETKKKKYIKTLITTRSLLYIGCIKIRQQ